MRKKTRLALIGAAFAVAGSGISISFAGSANAYPPPAFASVTTPNMSGSSVADGGLLTVKGSGFTPASVNPSGIQIIECSDPGGLASNLPFDASTCEGTTINSNQVNPNASGTFTDQYPVQALSTATSSINCDATDYCVLWVGDDYNGDFNDPITQAFSAPFLVVPAAAPTITSASSASFPTFQHSPAPSFTVRASGIDLPALEESGPLPGGVTFTDNGNGTATLAGTPTVTGTFPLTITASNGKAPNNTQSFTLYSGFVVTTTSIPPASATGTYSAQVNVVGGTAPYKFKIKGLPKGIKGSKSGAISGTPSSKDHTGTYSVTVTATDAKVKTSTKHPNANGHGKETATATLSLVLS
ncbi:MAG: putative Ig domain-containing protein [Fimbriimonadales bacterium]